MSKCTKGKLRADIKSGCIISDKGFMICDVGFVNTHPVANAKELVRRWNAFEEGGLVEELRTACEGFMKAWLPPETRSICQLDIDMNSAYQKAVAALAKS